MGKPSRSCHGEGHVLRTCSGVESVGFLRGTGGGTCGRLGTEQERPVCASLRRARDRSYKPMVKSAGVQRESDGVVVPVIGVQQNAPGGKGPDFGRAGRVGKREGMAGFPGPTTPARRSVS